MNKKTNKKLILTKNTIIYLNKSGIIIKGLLGKVFLKSYNVFNIKNFKIHKKQQQVTKNTYQILLNKYITGVVKGYIKKIKLEGMGYRMNIINNKKISFVLGYSHNITVHIPTYISFKISDRNTKLTLISYDFNLLSLFTKKIESLKKRNIYTGNNIIILK
jgi:large subunit ribosomal protein L6